MKIIFQQKISSTKNSGGPQLRVLSVSGVVRQCRAPDPAGRTADNAEGTRGQRGAVDGEKATGAGKGSGSQGTSRGDGGSCARGERQNASGRRNVPRKPAQPDTEEKDQRLVPSQDVPYALILWYV